LNSFAGSSLCSAAAAWVSAPTYYRISTTTAGISTTNVSAAARISASARIFGTGYSVSANAPE